MAQKQIEDMYNAHIAAGGTAATWRERHQEVHDRQQGVGTAGLAAMRGEDPEQACKVPFDLNTDTGAADMVREAARQLNSAIMRCADRGLNVDIETQRYDRLGSTPYDYVQVNVSRKL